MKRFLIICLAILSLLAIDNPAEAGRRKERKAAKKGGGGGVYAQRSTYSAAPAAVVTANYQRPVLAASPDLIITDIAAVGDSLACTVKNVGQAASPECRLEIALTQGTQAGQAANFEAQNVRVLPLLPNQSVRIRMSSVPVQNIQATALVDPDHLVAETDEKNNELRVAFVTETVAAAPPTLAEEHAWSQAKN